MRAALRTSGAALCVALLAGCGAATDAAATVNGDVISTSSVQAASDRYAGTDAFKNQAQQSSGPETERTFQQSWLSRLIRARVLGPAAAKRGIEVGDGEVRQQIEQIKQANFRTEKEYRQALAAQGLTEPVLEQLIRQSLVEQRLQAAVTKNVEPSTVQLKRVYHRNIARYRETRSSHILLNDNGLAQTLYRKLRGLPPSKLRTEFAQLAEEHSIDKTSGMKVGDLSPPVRSEAGFHIILVTGRRTESFAQVRDQIASQVAKSEKDAAWSRFVRSRYESAAIEVNPAFGRLDLTTQAIVNPAAGDVPATDKPAPGGSPAPAPLRPPA